MEDKDFILVGQGLAGTLLAHFLKAAGQRILVIDQPNENTASQIAAGIINPVTGRRFVKSWMIETLLPFAKATYQSIESQLNIHIYHEKNILRALANPKEENDWLARATEPSYSSYLAEQADPENYRRHLQPFYAFGETKGSAQVNLPALIGAYRIALKATGAYLEEPFDYQAITEQDDQVTYKQWKAKGIVFCEGYGMKTNPYFKDLPMRGDKGQVLHVRIPEAGFEKIFKDQVFIAPMAGGQYWIGATYEPHFEQEKPTEAGKDFLIAQLSATLKLPFEVTAHKAAVRPTVKDRRPLLGTHPDFRQLHLFNGLGTKGTSLGPYWAKHLTDYLLGFSKIDALVDIRRF
ncbi:MAG: FAD-dependent oxidoreductase [Saprospiraceae bacterium]|nr:FAD-dependent oxidoreductase [Saprospiraceae bacterium]MDZ4703031.1 FAD-dependent oxidoreductase [Saprospiraceae bacterium]